ncbi:C-C motif chemokine 22 isoform X1 [Malaclemys terrapin pileata]|uniref:C-C motif chemokine 22 isoform X1 n=1 Tax=Malaclemys terrapin pileata TaxID=2991368 RepID=UPI0023A858A7|nr:C-C motif chemokine 22 isoform X1 [Malaclemys terrapin pileata]
MSWLRILIRLGMSTESDDFRVALAQGIQDLASSLSPQGILEDTTCCTGVTKGPIRFANLRSFYWTSPGCRKPAVVFVTVQNRDVCAAPEAKWVQAAIRRLRKKK